VKGGQIEILPVGKEHLPALVELAGVIWRQHYPAIISRAQIDYMLPKMYSPEILREEMRSRGICFYRLMLDGKMAGFASVGPFDAPGVWKLHKCYLLPEFHGRGLGRHLLQHCETKARESGALRLLLTVNKRNARPIAAYHRHGFVIVDAVVTDFGGGFVMDDFIMAKDLNADETKLPTLDFRHKAD
jgi:diamine N-acetyltransferase